LFGASRFKIEEYGKSAAGKALIKLFSCPVKPTKAKRHENRIYPEDQPEKWEEFKEYCISRRSGRACVRRLAKILFQKAKN
jgi:DNA polymerase